MFNQGFTASLTPALREALELRAAAGRRAVLTATTVAKSGHPGGSFSSMEIFTLLFSCARVRPAEPRWPARDRIVISHGHTSPGAYVALAEAGFFPVEEVEAHFRQIGSVFEGHVERSVPGIEWSTGNLGQGLSAGVGFSLASRITGGAWHTYVAMSDGEQQKGQVGEARRLAAKEGLTDLTVIVDLNGIQISGQTSDVMPVPVAAGFAADGWHVVAVDGHDIEALYEALSEAHSYKDAPTAIIAQTVIGKGVSFMEGQAEFHGRGLTAEEYERALVELGALADVEEARARRSSAHVVAPLEHGTPAVAICAGESRVYDAGTLTDNRSAWGTALVDIADENPGVPVVVLDCDLASSVKTDGFHKRWPERFIQCGVGEHNAATVGGALSVSGTLAFWADFGVFGIDEVYNQQRLNDINGAGLKLVVTHCGLDVGEDGKTHQCLDYVGALRDFFGWRVIVPADPNQTDRAVRAAAGMAGNVCIAMGRSKLPVILDEAGAPLFGEGYEFRYGEIVWARRGAEVVLMTMGTTAGATVAAADELRALGIDAGAAVASCPLALDSAEMAHIGEAGLLVTIEDHGVLTGLGASVAEWLTDAGVDTRLVRLGVGDYQQSGSAPDLLAAVGLDTPGIVRSVRATLGR